MRMTVQELIDELMLVDDKNLIVVLETDHGQTPMKINGCGAGMVEDKNAYMMDSVYQDENGLDEDGEIPSGDHVYFLQAY